MKRPFAFSRRVTTALAAGLLSLAAAGVPAQSFESVFGPAATLEDGSDVKTVRFCPGGGFVAVGTSSATSANSNVYLVRTSSSGTPMFERLYAVVGASNARAFAVVEASNGSGFVIAGSTRQGTAAEDVLLLKVNCSGVVVWAYSYGSTGADVGFDVIEAQTGDPTRGTNRGDIVVAGRAALTGLLLRTRSDGTLIWNQQYPTVPATQGIFRGLAEAPPALIEPFTGDIVAAGTLASLSLGPSSGYVVRVNGNDGTIGSLSQAAFAYGAGTSFSSVVALRSPSPHGSLVLAGQIASPAGAGTDVLLVRTAANPAAVLAARRIGEPNIDEAALKLREMPDAPIRLGDLALTGRVGRIGNDAQDAFLLVADSALLQPIGPAQLFGNHADFLESGASLAVHPNGFVLTGVSRSDFGGVGDQGDLYLVGTDVSGRTACSVRWDPPSAAVNMPATRIAARALPSSLQQVRRDVRVISLATAFPVCRP